MGPLLDKRPQLYRPISSTARFGKLRAKALKRPLGPARLNIMIGEMAALKANAQDIQRVAKNYKTKITRLNEPARKVINTVLNRIMERAKADLELAGKFQERLTKLAKEQQPAGAGRR